MKTRGQSNLTKRPHRRRTSTVQSYSHSGDNVHPHINMLPSTHPSPQPKRHLDRSSRRPICRAYYCDRQTDRPRYWSVTIGCICVCSTAMRPNNVMKKIEVKMNAFDSLSRPTLKITTAGKAVVPC